MWLWIKQISRGEQALLRPMKRRAEIGVAYRTYVNQENSEKYISHSLPLAIMEAGYEPYEIPEPAFYEIIAYKQS